MDEDKFEKAKVIKNKIDNLNGFLIYARKYHELSISTIVDDFIGNAKFVDNIQVKDSVKEKVLDVVEEELNRLKDEFNKI